MREVHTRQQQRRQRNFTTNEKENYYLQWERSGESKTTFCQKHGIAKSVFYNWCKQFKKSRLTDAMFSPVTLKTSRAKESEKIMQLEICLPNLTKVFFPIERSQVIGFIQELCHATEIVR